jgi:hypothetical protein
MYRYVGPWWLPAVFIWVLAFTLYYALQQRVPRWALVFLTVTLVVVGTIAVLIDAILSGHVAVAVAVGYNTEPPPWSEPPPWWAYLLGSIYALLVVAGVVYLIRRR